MKTNDETLEQLKLINQNLLILIEAINRLELRVVGVYPIGVPAYTPPPTPPQYYGVYVGDAK